MGDCFYHKFSIKLHKVNWKIYLNFIIIKWVIRENQNLEMLKFLTPKLCRKSNKFKVNLFLFSFEMLKWSMLVFFCLSLWNIFNFFLYLHDIYFENVTSNVIKCSNRKLQKLYCLMHLVPATFLVYQNKILNLFYVLYSMILYNCRL